MEYEILFVSYFLYLHLIVLHHMTDIQLQIPYRLGKFSATAGKKKNTH